MFAIQLLNTTVASLALSVNSVLTACYKQCYGSVGAYEEDDECMLLTAALASTTEVQALYTAQLIDFESAIPAALHSLGATASEITYALERKRKLEEEKKKESDTAAEGTAIDNEAKRASVSLQEAQVEKTKAETTATLNPPERPAASASGI